MREDSECLLSDGDGERLVQIAECQIVLSEAEEVSEFVKVSGADLVGKDLGIPLGEVPEVV